MGVEGSLAGRILAEPGTPCGSIFRVPVQSTVRMRFRLLQLERVAGGQDQVGAVDEARIPVCAHAGSRGLTTTAIVEGGDVAAEPGSSAARFPPAFAGFGPPPRDREPGREEIDKGREQPGARPSITGPGTCTRSRWKGANTTAPLNASARFRVRRTKFLHAGRPQSARDRRAGPVPVRFGASLQKNDAPGLWMTRAASWPSPPCRDSRKPPPAGRTSGRTATAAAEYLGADRRRGSGSRSGS